MGIKFNKKKAEGDFKQVPEGVYECFISAVDVGYSQNGNEKMVLNYKVREDVDLNGQDEYGGQEIRYDNFTNTENAEWRIHKLLDALNVEEGTEFDSLKDIANYVRGKAILIEVEHEEQTMGKNKGKKFAKARDFRMSGVGGQMTEGGRNQQSSEEKNPFAEGNNTEAPQTSDDDSPF